MPGMNEWGLIVTAWRLGCGIILNISHSKPWLVAAVVRLAAEKPLHGSTCYCWLAFCNVALGRVFVPLRNHFSLPVTDFICPVELTEVLLKWTTVKSHDALLTAAWNSLPDSFIHCRYRFIYLFQESSNMPTWCTVNRTKHTLNSKT